MAIRSFARPAIKQFFLHGKTPAKAGWASVKNIAARKLDMLDYAVALSDLKVPPGNRLEALKGDLAGFFSSGPEMAQLTWTSWTITDGVWR